MLRIALYGLLQGGASDSMKKDEPFSLKGKRIWVAGHRGMVGSAVVDRLKSEDCEILTAPRSELDLTNQNAVDGWMRDHRPAVVVIAAAKVGGILANNTYPVDFLYDNLMIEANLIYGSYRHDVEKLLFVGSGCMYPKFTAQPIPEDALLTGQLEPTNQWYAIAKIAGVMLCQALRRQYDCDFISAMPCNVYGPNDNFDNLRSNHVVPALLVKAHYAKQTGAPLEIWGTGSPRREFVHVHDLAEALVFLLKSYSGERQVNIGYGEDLSVLELADAIKTAVDYRGKVVFDGTKPDGAPRKLLDSSLIRSMGWAPKIDLHQGLCSTYAWYLKHVVSVGRGPSVSCLSDSTEATGLSHFPNKLASTSSQIT
jgi:GDP-L-fucose synthase